MGAGCGPNLSHGELSHSSNRQRVQFIVAKLERKAGVRREWRREYDRGSVSLLHIG